MSKKQNKGNIIDMLINSQLDLYYISMYIIKDPAKIFHLKTIYNLACNVMPSYPAEDYA